MNQTKTYRGLDLLELILDFIDLTPNEHEWNYRALKHNKPRQVRLLQIKSLLKAFEFQETKTTYFEKVIDYINFDLKKEIKSLLQGEFIENKNLGNFEELIDYATTYMIKNNHNLGRPIRLAELRFIFPKLVEYKIKMRALTNFNNGWIEASGTFVYFHIFLTNSISSRLAGQSDELDQVLELFINPKKYVFTEIELIKKYNFPTDNLAEIDLENY